MKEIKEENSTNNEMGKRSVRWAVVLFYVYLHVLGITGILFLFTRANWITVFYCEYMTYILLYGTMIEKTYK